MSEQPFATQCTVCGHSEIGDLITLDNVPIHCNVLWPTKDGALNAPRGNIHLGFCQKCSHIFNMAFDPELMEYTQAYENSLHFSPRFRQYAGKLAHRLVEQYDLHDKDIVDIGSGQGDFLRMLCQLGGNRGVGFDPSYVDEETDSQNQVSFVRDYYSEAYAEYPADFVCSRHVLEHIRCPADFLAMVRRVVGERQQTVVFFEVPNALFTLHQLGIWDIIYEHCSYFSPYSLAAVFTNNDFSVLSTQETFGGQFVTAEARPANGDPAQPAADRTMVERMAQDVVTFADSYRNKIASWQLRFQQLAQIGYRAVVWGAGSKGVTFMNALKEQDVIEYAVDINPRKIGMHVAGTGQEIVPPEFLQDYQPEVVIIMNANYQKEIGQQLKDLDVPAYITQA